MKYIEILLYLNTIFVVYFKASIILEQKSLKSHILIITLIFVKIK